MLRIYGLDKPRYVFETSFSWHSMSSSYSFKNANRSAFLKNSASAWSGYLLTLPNWLLWSFSILTKFESPNCSFHNMILYDILFIFSKIFYKWPLVVVEWSLLIKPRYYVITLFNRFWIWKTFRCVVPEYFFNKLVFFFVSRNVLREVSVDIFFYM